MDTNNLISRLARRTATDTATAGQLLDALVQVVREQCADCNRVALPGFGSFEGVKHEEEIITDLTTGKRMLLPPAVEIVFHPGAMLKKRMKEGVR